jgi:hypothetical protein
MDARAPPEGRRGRKLRQLLKEIGVLTRHGKLAKRSVRWGKKPSRTPLFEE